MTGPTALTPQPMSPPYPAAGHCDTAKAIQAAHPDWLVMWGVFTHQYVAFPLFHAPAGSIVQSASPERLVRRMRHAELALTAQAHHRPVFDPFQAARHHDAAPWQGGERPESITRPGHPTALAGAGRPGRDTKSRCPMVPGPQPCARLIEHSPDIARRVNGGRVVVA